MIYKTIRRGFEFMYYNNIRRLLSCARRAVDEYKMIEDGDRIAVGLSGGKDSAALLCVLDSLRIFYPKKFELSAVTVDMDFAGAGFGEMDFSPAVRFCAEAGIEYKIVKTRLASLIFNDRKESNPCSLCARMRRGILHDAVVELGANKLALGHHFDDVVETFMLNLFNEGRLGTFSPVTYLSRKDITMIRPFVYAAEKDIRYFITKNPALPLIKSVCPEDGHTERESMKKLLSELDKSSSCRGLKHRIMTAIQRGHLDGY